MKITVAKILLILFSVFLAAPTILSVGCGKDTSVFFNMTEEEEENHSSYAKIKIEVFHNSEEWALFTNADNTAQRVDFLHSRLDNIPLNIILPPPELT